MTDKEEKREEREEGEKRHTISIFRGRSSAAVDFLKPYLIEEDMSRETAADVLKRELQANAEGLYILMALIDDSELAAFIIAVTSVEQRHVFILQAWSDAKLLAKEEKWKNVPERMFLRMVLWAEALGKTSIRAETKRATDAFLRRWNFKETSRILSFDIEEDFEERILEGKRDVLIGKEKTQSGISSKKESKDEQRPIG